MSSDTSGSGTERNGSSSMASGGTPGDILLDAGTNELEVLVFELAGGLYGVNVAKVREVVRGQAPTSSPGTRPGVLGMVNMRGELIPIVDLKSQLGLGVADIDDIASHRIIVTEFNGRRTGFIVDAVDQIRRLSWTLVKPAPELDSLGTSGAAVSSCTGVIELDERLILMIDFESVADGILYEDKLHYGQVENPDGIDRASKVIFVVEDSPFMRETMQTTLHASGYTGVRMFTNGAEAWNALNNRGEGEPAVEALISDIEMPQMDGLHLARRVRDDARYRDLPLVLFSSLISEDNIKKGEQVGADMQIPKPELPDLVRLIDKLVTGRVDEVRKENTPGVEVQPGPAAAA